MKKLEHKGINLPKGIKKETFSFISNIIDCFEEEGKLDSLDALSIYLLASNLDIYLKCEAAIRKHGITVTTDRGNENLSPYCTQQKAVTGTILSLLKELGLTLGSRTKMKVIESSDTDSPLLKFLQK